MNSDDNMKDVVFDEEEVSDTKELEISDSDSDGEIFPNVIRKMNFDEEEKENSERAIVGYDQKRESEFQFAKKAQMCELVKRFLFLGRRINEPKQLMGDLSIFSKAKVNEVYLQILEDIEVRLFGHLPWFTTVDGDLAIISEYKDLIIIHKITLPMFLVPIVDQIFIEERMFEEPKFIIDYQMFPQMKIVLMMKVLKLVMLILMTL